MEIKWYATRFIDRLRPGQEIPEGAYDEEQLQQMLRNRMARREVIDDAPAPAPRKKSAAKKSASTK